jgi:excisionase family DNA binding protein
MDEFVMLSDRRSPIQNACLLSPEELAAFLGVPLPTIYRWRTRRQGPPGFRVGRHVRYSLEEVHEWLESRRDEIGPREHQPSRSRPSRLTAVSSGSGGSADRRRRPSQSG